MRKAPHILLTCLDSTSSYETLFRLCGAVFTLHLYPLSFHNMSISHSCSGEEEGQRPLTISFLPFHFTEGLKRIILKMPWPGNRIDLREAEDGLAVSDI